MKGLSKEVEEFLKEIGAVHVRNNRHSCWRLPNGRIFIHSISPRTDATNGQLRDLRKLLKLPKEEIPPRAAVGRKKQRQARRERRQSEFVHVRSLKSELRRAGLV